MAGQIFSFPAFAVVGNYTVTGYNVYVSRSINSVNGNGNVGNYPNYFGPYVALSGYTNYASNTDIIDVAGTTNDLYRVEPIISVTLPDGSTGSITLAQSKPFFAWQPLYDMQISSLIDNFRNNWVKDPGVPQTESTIPSESTGGNVQPFITDASTSRFYLSFLPNDDPIRVQSQSVMVWNGDSEADASPLVQYQDYWVNELGGYLQFQQIPDVSSYLRVEFTKVVFTDDIIRSTLLNCVSDLSNYGINGYQVNQSNNLLYLATPLANRDLGEIICSLGYKRLLNSDFIESLANNESWKDGNSGVEWSADPSRSLQAAAVRLADVDDEIRRRCNLYIYNTRDYIAYGEFDSFFDVSGVLPVYTLIVAGANLGGAIGWWI